MTEEVDTEILRQDLINYFEGAYVAGGYGAALIESINLYNASPEELVRIANDNNINLSNYIIDNTSKKLNRW